MGCDVMKKYIFPLALFLVVILPSMLVTHDQMELFDVDEMQPSSEPIPINDIMIRVKDGESIIQMELENYLLCVLLGEVPVEFEPEAIKAQSVATRTYTLRKVNNQFKHEDADVCTEASCCQAFISEETFLHSGGSHEDLIKMKNITQATFGEVLTYQGNLIEATYFSCSGGKTEDAVAVWGTSIPYLKSVDSPGEEHAAHFEDSFRFSIKSFCRQLGITQESMITDDNLKLSYTEGNGVDKLRIGDEEFSGTQLRTLLSLPSTCFTISVQDDEVFVNTRGHGHRVGMSQYGADAMAMEGKSYREILSYYYPGTQLEKYIAK
jgi:stage II sporulation protein D